MIMAGGRSLGLFHVIVILLLHLKPALAFSAHDIGCIERERQALLVFKQGLVDEFGILSSWGSEDNNKNCCQWRGIQCSKRTGHLLKLDLANDGYGPLRGSSLNYWDGNYLDIAKVVLKGREFEYGKNLGLLRIIDLSSNKLIGKLPNEILSLSELVALNISRNSLTGDIPSMIGQLKQLESLDLSRNKFYGEIPSTMSDLHFLSHMDLSYNNLYGKIPSGTQIRGFDASMFAGNDALCGPPLTNKCPGEETSNPREPTNGVGGDNEEDGDEFTKWFYAGMGLGFGASFWGVFGTLLLKRSWRHAYFIFLDNMKEWLLVTMAVNKARLKLKFQRHG